MSKQIPFIDEVGRFLGAALKQLGDQVAAFPLRGFVAEGPGKREVAGDGADGMGAVRPQELREVFGRVVRLSPQEPDYLTRFAGVKFANFPGNRERAVEARASCG